MYIVTFAITRTVQTTMLFAQTMPATNRRRTQHCSRRVTVLSTVGGYTWIKPKTAKNVGA